MHHLAFLRDVWDKFEIWSDIDMFVPMSLPKTLNTWPVLEFPVQGGPFLCSQGFGGELTHFLAETFFSIDFDCEVGTPILAVVTESS